MQSFPTHPHPAHSKEAAFWPTPKQHIFVVSVGPGKGAPSWQMVSDFTVNTIPSCHPVWENEHSMCRTLCVGLGLQAQGNFSWHITTPPAAQAAVHLPSLCSRMVGGTSTHDHTSACAWDGHMKVEAGQKFIIPPVTARNLSSHIPETPKPIISAARMTMTVVMLLGKKENTPSVESPPPSQPMPVPSICRLVCRKEVEANEPQTQNEADGEAHDHSSDENSGEQHLSSTVGDTVAGDPGFAFESRELAPVEDASICILWFISIPCWCL